MQNPSMTDEELMTAYQRGDVQAFRILFQKHQRGVFNYIYRYTGSRDESEEVFQDVFMKLHRAAATYQPTAKFSTWLYTIVRNLCIDVHRKKRLRHNVSMDEPLYEDARTLHDVIAAEKPAPDSKSSDQQVGKIVEEALAQINEDQREVFLMREKAGLKFEEIAELTGVSVNTVKSRMRYATESLRKYLEKTGYEDLNPNERVAAE